MRNYDQTGEVQGGSQYIYLKLNGRDGKIYAHIGNEKREMPGFTGYLEGFKMYEDPGNAEHQIRPHKGITLFLSGKNPATGEIAQYKLDQGLDNVSIAPTLLNALLGAEDELSKDTLLYFSVWLKDGKHARLTINIDGQKPVNKFPFNKDENWFTGVPRPQDVPDPVNGGTAKSWLQVKTFWVNQAEQFVHRMSLKFGQPDTEPASLDDIPDQGLFEGAKVTPMTDSDLTDYTPEELPAFTPEPEPKEDKIGPAQFLNKLSQIKLLKSADNLVTAYNSMLKLGLDEKQVKQARGVFVQTASILGAKITFGPDGATKDVTPEAEDETLPF